MVDDSYFLTKQIKQTFTILTLTFKMSDKRIQAKYFKNIQFKFITFFSEVFHTKSVLS